MIEEVNLRKHGKGLIHFKAKGSSNPEKRKPDKYGNYLSSATNIKYNYPLKLMIPAYASNNHCQWVYTINYGGGLVSGDEVSLEIEVEEGCAALLTSQGSTKVYHSVDDMTSIQTLIGKVGSHGMLAIIQEPLVCYKNAIYKQTQCFHLEKDSNLVFVDWITSGRIANGERWDFTRYISTNLIFHSHDLLYRDAQDLRNESSLKSEEEQHSAPSIKDTMQHFNVVACCIILGPDVEHVVKHVNVDAGARQDIGFQPDPDMVTSVSPLCYDIANSKDKLKGVLIKCSAIDLPKVYARLDRLLTPLYPKLGGNPFEGKY